MNVRTVDTHRLFDLRYQDGEVLLHERMRANRIPTGRTVHNSIHMPSLSELDRDSEHNDGTTRHEAYGSVALDDLSEPAPESTATKSVSKAKHPWRRFGTLSSKNAPSDQNKPQREPAARYRDQETIQLQPNPLTVAPIG